MKAECVKTTKDKIIVFNEKRSNLRFKNDERLTVQKIKVDDCEITEGVRCDYLMIAKNIEHYIELKGQDLNHAIAQIKRSIMILSTNVKLQDKVSYIICTRSPYATPQIQHLQLVFKKQFNSALVIRSSPYEAKL